MKENFYFIFSSLLPQLAKIPDSHKPKNKKTPELCSSKKRLSRKRIWKDVLFGKGWLLYTTAGIEMYKLV